MLASIITIFLLAVVGLLSLHEILRYRRARISRADLLYPRKRLSRRLAIALLFAAVLLLIRLKPGGMSAPGELGWYGFSLILMIIILILTLRDLHETSVSVVSEHRRFYEDARDRIKSSLNSELQNRKGNRNK